jgi:arylsulfatase A-like enzyme
MTVASLLKKHGYATACVGKWHLGMDMAKRAGGADKDATKGEGRGVDYAAPIRNGPAAVGFDYYFGISASLDMPPYVFIENDRFTAIPDVEKQWIRKGPAAKDFEAVDVLPALVNKAVAFIESKAAAS